ncbi:MAG: AAA family ATPase [Pseudomonadota bacterium]
MKNQFLHTGNVRRAIESTTALRNQGEKMPRLGAWHGEAGRGKTETSIFYCGKHTARMVTPKVNSSQLDLLNALYAELKGQKEAKFGRGRDAYDACLRLMFNSTEPVLIDEADRISGRTVLVETLRDLSDRTDCPIIFVGTDQMMVQLLQREQVASRLSQVVRFKPLSVEEVGMAAAELSGIQLNPAAAEVLHKISRGFFRDLKVALSHIERTVTANKISDPPAEMVEQVARKAIMRLAA